MWFGIYVKKSYKQCRVFLVMDVSIVVPTYNEAGNISKLVRKIFFEFEENKIDGEVIVVDDNSPDKTWEIVEGLKKKFPKLDLIRRLGKLGLSSAVIEGWKISKGDVIGVMDADLSHPVDKIHELYNSIRRDNFDMAVGSRYVKGGKIEGWGFGRLFCSKGSTLLAKVFTKIKDPMSGYFMIRRDMVNIDDLDAKGFKILLEVAVKMKVKKIKEVPITFVNRAEGKSKASVKEIRFYLLNLWGYFKREYPGLYEFFKFGIVGLSGAVLNLMVFYLMTRFLGVHYMGSAVVAFVLAATSNYLLNKVWTFNEKIGHKIARKFVQFFVVSIVTLGINLGILFALVENVGIHYMLAQAIAILLSMIFNYVGNKIWTFRK